MTTLILLYIPAIVFPALGLYIYRSRLNFVELATYICVGCLVATGGWYLGTYGNTLDSQVFNGQVAGKVKQQTNCEHSYSCNCSTVCTGTGSSRSCTTICQTCYEHSYDIDWNLKTTLGELTIDRVDRQGLVEPPRFTAAKYGDPVAVVRNYVNYIKASPSSLFNLSSNSQLSERFGEHIPTYPLSVYDYHYLDRVLFDRINTSDAKLWNRELAKSLILLGPSKQANLVILITKESDPTYAQAVNSAWLGGKKNDIIVIIGAPDYPNISWAHVISWTDKEILKVSLRDALLDLKTLSPDTVISTIHHNVDKHFVRKPMEEFKYLTEELEPPSWGIFMIIAILFLIGVVIPYFINPETSTQRRSRYYKQKRFLPK